MPPNEIFPFLVAAARRAAANGVSIDNLEALRAQIFAPSGTKHDGAGSGWESLAIGPDGRIYPSPALVGVSELATELEPDLATAWRRSPVLTTMRQASVQSLTSPWRFLLGGGDPNHSYLYYPIIPELAGPQFNIRFTFTPVIPAPAWSKRSIF